MVTTVQPVDAWQLTEELSIRDHIRVYTRHGGVVVNQTRNRAISLGYPNVPWAMYLADGRNYQYVVFDLDNHTNNQSEADSDVTAITSVLDHVGIEYLVCSSSANGGYHIWIAAIDNLNAALIRHLGLTMSRIYTTLDPTCLMNPVTGCVRPPLSPHWKNGASTIIRGSLDTLYYPKTTETQVENLLDNLTRLAQALPPVETHEEKTRRENDRDESGHAYIPGTARPLSPAIQTLLTTRISADTDTSVRLWQIVLSAVKHHWHYNQLTTFIEKHASLPGLAHAVSIRHGHTRIPRPASGSNSMRAVIGRMWNKAYTTITSQDKAAYQNTDSEFIARHNQVTALVDGLYAWNNTRETHGTGQASNRRVLNVLCLYALQANQESIQADTRRIALACGLSRQTVATSLHRLEKHGIIQLVKPSSGRVAHEWRLLKTKETCGVDSSVMSNLDTSKYAPTVNTLSTLRDSLIQTLTQWLNVTSHDACTHTGVGIPAGNKLADTSLTTPVDTDILDRIALKTGATGTVAHRKHVYEIERLLWAWWHQELTHLQTPHTVKHGRKPWNTATTMTSLVACRYPRQDNKPDYATARNRVLSLVS